METISGPRDSGKTEALIKKYRKTGGIIITLNAVYAGYLKGEFKIPDQDLYTFGDIEKGRLRGRRNDYVYIDNIDAYIDWKLEGRAKLVTATFTGKDISYETTPLYKTLNSGK